MIKTKMSIQKLNSLIDRESYEFNLENKIFLKDVNISSKIIESKIKKSIEMHKQFKQRQNRLEIARIYSELMRLDKINKINRNHMYRDFNYNRKKYLNKANISSDISRHYYNIDNYNYQIKKIK